MAQYIDKDKVVAEIERRIEGISNVSTFFALGRKLELANILSFLNTLEAKEVDLDFEKELYKAFGQVKDFTLGMHIARHFFELGLKTQSKDMIEALRTEYEKGRADVLRCIDPDEMVADFCSQPLSKTRSLASIYRQGIMDILKRINNNEETSITSTRSIDDCGL